MSQFPYVFLADKFRSDLLAVTERTSTRMLSAKIEGRLSPSTISRIQTGKAKNIKINEFLDLCVAMDSKPTDYIDKQLF